MIRCRLHDDLLRQRRKLFRNKTALAWIMMVSAAAVHVFDESVTGLLPFYNELARDLKQDYGFPLIPTFSFELWLGGLVVAIIAAFALTPIVSRDSKITRVVIAGLGILMVLNACGHIAGSLYLRRILPGFWSSPLLLGAAVYLVVRSLNRPSEIAGPRVQDSRSRTREGR